MTQPDTQSSEAIYRTQAGIVAGLLMDTLRRELAATHRRGKHELLASALSHGRIGDMIRGLAQTIPQDLAAVIRETSLALDEELPRIEQEPGKQPKRVIDADLALSNIETTQEVIQWLVRIFRILRTIFAATLMQDHSVEGCAALACVTYGRILEVVGLREASFESALELRKSVIKALQMPAHESEV